MGLECFFGHKWEIISIWNFRDTSYSEEGVASHQVTQKCARCNKLKVKSYFARGYLYILGVANRGVPEFRAKDSEPA